MKITKRIRHDAKELLRLCLVDGRLDEGRVRQIAEALQRSQRNASLPLLAQFLRRVRLAMQERTATVDSATPLSAEFREKVRGDLIRTYGPGVTVEFRDAPKLLGGMRIRIGSDVYDGSVQARLADLEARF